MLMFVVRVMMMRMVVGVRMRLLARGSLGRPRRVLRSIDDHINFGRADATAVHPRNFQLRSNAEGLDRLLENYGRNSSVDQGAQEHIAADSGEAV